MNVTVLGMQIDNDGQIQKAYSSIRRNCESLSNATETSEMQTVKHNGLTEMMHRGMTIEINED
jgi:hypothetical protein